MKYQTTGKPPPGSRNQWAMRFQGSWLTFVKGCSVPGYFMHVVTCGHLLQDAYTMMPMHADTRSESDDSSSEEQITPSFKGKALQYKGSKDTAEHEGIVDRRSTWISRVMSMGPSHIKALGHFKRGALLVEARLELFTGSCYARVGVAEGKTYICLYPASTKIGQGRSWPRERCKCSFQRPWRYYRSPHFHTCDHTSRLHVLTEHGSNDCV